MKSLKHLLAATGLLVALPSVAGTYEWTTSFAMGVTQYQVDDGNNIDLWVACPTDRGISAGLTVDGTHISSEQQPGFDLLVDGELYSNPFFTNCRVCDANFRQAFWDAFRQANKLKAVVGDRVINLPTTNLSELLAPFDDPANPCQSAWW